MRAPRPAPTDVGGRRGALVRTLLAVAAIVVLITVHVAAACCPETSPGSHHPAVALAAADAPAQATNPDCATTSTWTAPAVLGSADPSHAPVPAVLYVLVAALAVVPVITGFLRPGGSRAPPSHSRRLATLCVLRT